MGTIVTFYSYKGGVGRTMALANVAVLLARWGKKVLLVDWDLEAPGVEHFFFAGSQLWKVQGRLGLIDTLTEAAATSAPEYLEDAFLSRLIPIQLQDLPAFSLLTAGRRGDGYFKRVRALDVATFYERHDGGYIIEGMRTLWRTHFDFVLVDSRTGITDIGGICTIQLPDILALVFTATEQSLMGAVDVAQKASIERQKLPFDRAQVPVFPVPSRFDTQTEHEIAKQWLGRFEAELETLYLPWLPKSVNRRHFLEVTKVPYTPYFSFGEKLPVIEQGTRDPSGLGFAYETIAAVIGNELQRPELVLDDRTEFIRLATLPKSKSPEPDHYDRGLLYAGVASARSLTNSGGETDAESREISRQFSAVIHEAASAHQGEISLLNDDGALLVFASAAKALACALEIQEILAVRAPVSTSAGPLRARIGVHTLRPSEPAILREGSSAVVLSIANKAAEGHIVVSAEIARFGSSMTVPFPALRISFNPRPDQLELPPADSDIEEALFDAVAVMSIDLTPDERVALLEQSEESKNRGGFQNFLVGLQRRLDTQSGQLDLTITDRERIARYAFDYKSGGWQARLRRIFGRSLGPNLGRAGRPA